MALSLTQIEADALLAMEKHCADSGALAFPSLGGSLRIPLASTDRREEFMLDITRGHIEVRKNTFQNRARKAVVLARLDLGGQLHRNPDGEEVPCPHLHIFREGQGDKWAIPAPADWNCEGGALAVLDQFMRFCNIATKPDIRGDMFA
jgi:hypothetical protein